MVSGVSSSLLSSANGGIGVSNVLPSERSNPNLPLNKFKKKITVFLFSSKLTDLESGAVNRILWGSA